MEDWFENFDDDSSTQSSDEVPYEQHRATQLPRSEPKGKKDEEVDPLINYKSHKNERYKVIGADELRESQLEAMGQVGSILGCSNAEARAMLTAHYWDAETLLNMVGERGIDVVKQRCGLVGKGNTIQQAELDRKGTSSQGCPVGGGFDPPVCQVCFSSTQLMMPMNPFCSSSDHLFCKDCWKEYLCLSIAEGKSRDLRCMAPRCRLLCDEDQVRQLITEHRAANVNTKNTEESISILEKYERSLLEGFVEDNKKMRWCPSSPHCGRSVMVTSDDCHCEIECPCGEVYCFSCGKSPHSPATCDMIAQWRQRIMDGTPSDDWVNAHTMQCPTCGNSIEKNGGCNLMQCRCGATFCWLCGQKTGKDHDYYQITGHSCGAYIEDAKQQSDEAERNLKRFLHFYTRYEAHLNSSRLEEQLQASLDKKIACMMNDSSGSRLPNYAWLHEAFEQLCLARKIMSFSYVFAYFIFGPHATFFSSTVPLPSMQALFEDKQGQLEIEVERLADILEKTPATNMPEKRFAVINLTSGINRRIIKMYEVIENDIVPQSAGRPMGVSPYKGRASKMNASQSMAICYPRVEERVDSMNGGPSKRLRQR
jgi:ariadne-1